MLTVRCKRCNETLTSRHSYDFQVCSCDNQTYVKGDVIGGRDLKHVIQIGQPRDTDKLGIGKEEQKKRTTRLSDVQIR
jgi:hypothetical protein